MPILFILIIALIFCFFHIKGQKAEERKAEEECQRLVEERLRDEGIKQEAKEKMQNHPLLTLVENCLIAEIDVRLRLAGREKISPTESDKVYLHINSDAVEFGCKEISYSSFGYDCFESVYDLQAFGESLYRSLKTHYVNHSGLSWRYSEVYHSITIDITACHPKLKSI